ARFATAARPNERHETHVLAFEQLSESPHSPFSSDEPRDRGGEIVLVGVHRKAGAAEGSRLIMFCCQCTERRCLPFVITKDSRAHLCQFEQVKCFLLGS